MLLAQGCAAEFPEGITNGAKWYDVPGGMQDFNYLHSNAFEITVELSCCKYPSAQDGTLQKEWDNNKEALLSYMELVTRDGTHKRQCLRDVSFQSHLGVKGLIRDATTRTGISGAMIQVEGVLHPVRSVKQGAYWRLLLPGLHNITVTASGYLPQTKYSVNVTNANTSSVSFSLSVRLLRNDDSHSFTDSILISLSLCIFFQALRLDFDLQPATQGTVTSVIKEAASINDVYTMLSTYADKLMSDAREDVLRALVEPADVFQYHDYESMVKKLKELNQRYPNITSLYTIGKSNENRDLWVMIVSDQPLIHEPGEPEVKYIGNIHGDESVGRECLIRFIEYLCVNYGKNEYLTGLVNNVSHLALFLVN